MTTGHGDVLEPVYMEVGEVTRLGGVARLSI